MHLRSCRALAALLLALPCLPARAQAPAPAAAPAAPPAALRLPAGMQRVTAVEGITEYSLPNGLRVLLFPDPSVNTLTVNITFKVGSRHEGYGETGMAHLLEHMVFKGTPRHPNIAQELTEHGAQANGTTSFDRTNYYETVPATEANLRWALELEADRMVNSYIRRSDLESEFSVVRNEFESGENSPAAVLSKRMLGVIFQFSNYGHSPIGEKSDIEGAPIERLQTFYRLYYQPDNAVLLVSGRFDQQRALDLIQETFGAIARPSRQIPADYTREPVQDGERRVTLRRKGDVQIVSAMYRTPPGSHPDHAAVQVLGNLLADSPAGRLYQALVAPGKAASFNVDANGFAGTGVLEFNVNVRLNQSADEALATLTSVLDQVATAPPAEADVERAKTRILRTFEIQLSQSRGLGLSLSNHIGVGDWRLAFLGRDQVMRVTPADITRVARSYLKPANRTIGVFLPDSNPDRAAIPEPPDVGLILAGYQGRAAAPAGEEFDSSPENLERRTQRFTLANGMQVALLPKATRNNAVRAVLTLRFGTLESLAGKALAGTFAANLLARGSTTKSRQEVQDTLARLKSTVSAGGAASGANFQIQTDRANVADTLRLVAELAKQPAFPAEEFETLKRQQLAAIETQRSQAQPLAGNTFTRVMRPPYARTDPRYVENFDEQVASLTAITLDQLHAFHREFYGASNATLAVVGDFDPAEMRTLLAGLFGEWRSPGPFRRIETPYVPLDPRVETIRTPDQANAVYQAGIGFAMRDDDPEAPAVTMAGFMMGGGFLNSRLATRIRQRDGLSYGVSGSFTLSPQDRDARFSATMIFNPGNLARLEAAFREEVERAARDGFTAEELAAAKTGWLDARKVARANDQTLAATMNNYLFFGRNFTFDAARDAAVQSLTLEQVNAAARKYLDYSRVIIVKAGDFPRPL
jgi:zinc protease